MTIQEAKDIIAKKTGFESWDNIRPDYEGRYFDEVAELYARAKWDEACEAQKQMIWNDLKIHTTAPNNVFGEVVNVTRVVNATYEHAPKPEFKP